MRYSLHTLMILAAIGPPLLAVAYWTCAFCYEYPQAIALFAYLAAAIYGPIACYRELIQTICGPAPTAPSRGQRRRSPVRRFPRYAGSSSAVG